MSDDFDPYFKWLGIPPDQQPPDLYRLLGVPLFTEDPDVISHAVDRQMAHLRTFQSGPNAVHSQKLLNEISAARGCLLNAQRKAEYDRQLRQEIEVQQQPAEFFEADSQVFPPPSSQPPPLDPTTSSPEAAWPGTGSRSSTSRTYRKKPKKKKNSQLSLILILLFAALILGIALLNLLPEPQGAQPPAPVITPITNQEVAVGETLELAVIARSRAGTSTRLSYHLAESPRGAQIDPQTGLFTWTPRAEDRGQSEQVIVRVNDDNGQSETESFVIRIAPAPPPPEGGPAGEKPAPSLP